MDYETNHTTKKEKGFGKRIATTIGAGLLGSVLTLGVVFNTNLLPEATSNAKTPVEQTTNYPVQQTAANDLSLTDMIEKASSAIVGVVNYQNGGSPFMQEVESRESGTGSGVIYKVEDDYAYIITNNHVIEDAQKLEVSLENGEKVAAELVGQDALTDLAVLKIDAKHAEYALPFGDSDALRSGDSVVAIGNPLGLDFSGTVTKGIISAKNRSINVNTSAGEWALNVIQTDAAINPGNSGGALLNSAGEVIGINSLKIAKDGVEGIGFAIPSNDVIPLAEEMMKSGKIERPYLGVSMVDLDQISAQYTQFLPDNIDGGVIIANVDPNAAASQAGIQSEDIVTEINGTPIENAQALKRILYTELKIGDQAEFTIYRGTEKQTVSFTLSAK